MAAHAIFKNEFKEEEKYHNLMSWLNYSIKMMVFFKMHISWAGGHMAVNMQSTCLGFIIRSCEIAINASKALIFLHLYEG